MAEFDRRQVDWEKVKDDAWANFSRFRDGLATFTSQSPGWKLAQNQAGEGTMQLIECSYSKQYGKGVMIARVSANIIPRGTKANLGLSITEARDFEAANIVLTEVGESLLPLLNDSGLVPLSGGRNSLGRKSVSSVAWVLYPDSHPRVLGGK